MNIEDAFIQLFERKGRIGDQIRQQVHSHAETLSVNFEASGRGDPPQFQWNNGTAAASDFSFPAGLNSLVNDVYIFIVQPYIVVIVSFFCSKS